MKNKSCFFNHFLIWCCNIFSPNECPGLYWYSLFNSLGKKLKVECKQKWKRQFWVFISHIKKNLKCFPGTFHQITNLILRSNVWLILVDSFLRIYLSTWNNMLSFTIIGIAWSAKNIFPQFSSRRPHLILNIWCGLRCYKNNS